LELQQQNDFLRSVWNSSNKMTLPSEAFGAAATKLHFLPKRLKLQQQNDTSFPSVWSCSNKMTLPSQAFGAAATKSNKCPFGGFMSQLHHC
jgi:hypothetical protein